MATPEVDRKKRPLKSTGEQSTRVRGEREELKQLLIAGGFDLLGAASPDGVYAYDLDGNFIDANAVFLRRSEFTAEEMADRPYGTGAVEEDREITSQNFHAAAHGEPRAWRTTVYTASGRRVNVLTTAFPFHVDGVCRAVIGIVRDVELLEQTERQTITQAALLDAARDAMIVRHLDGSIAYWNRAAADLYGWSSEQAVGSLARDLFYRDPTEYDDAVRGVMRDGYWFGTLHQHTKDGREITVEGRWTLVRTPDGRPDSIFIVNSDITLQLQQEQQRLRTQRMESLGRLAGGIAHDLNNVLTPILMSAQLLIDAQEGEPERDLAIGIERAAARGADLIHQVLAFARGDDGARERIDVRTLLADLDSFCRETLPKSIAVTVNLGANIPDVRGDATQLMQVLINLVVNARDAMPEGGTLTLAAYGTPVGPKSGPGMVVIEVTDDGSGMDAATLETIFDPFFTTKALGSGTGLGLATSLSIAQRHGGSLTAVSALGSGTKLRLELPVYESDLGTQTAPAPVIVLPQEAPPGTGQLILVVDDEIAIRHVNCVALSAAGYCTLVAANGAEGLAVYKQNRKAIDLVLTDLMMPVMDGAAMAMALRGAGYAGPILTTSGGMRAGAAVEDIEDAHFLPKPYTTHDLLRAVHELVAEPAALLKK